MHSWLSNFTLKTDCVRKEICTDSPPFLPYIPPQNEEAMSIVLIFFSIYFKRKGPNIGTEVSM